MFVCVHFGFQKYPHPLHTKEKHSGQETWLASQMKHLEKWLSHSPWIHVLCMLRDHLNEIGVQHWNGVHAAIIIAGEQTVISDPAS